MTETNPTMGGDGLVERLRACHEYAMAHLAVDLQPAEDDPPPHSIYAEAADRIEALEGERDALIDESAALTRALTGCTRGGSEFFSRKGERFVADIGACVADIRRRFEDAMQGRLSAHRDLKASEALVTSLRNQLEGAKGALREIDKHRLNIKPCVADSTPKWLGEISDVLDEGRRLAASTLDQLEGKGIGASNASPSPLDASHRSSSVTPSLLPCVFCGSAQPPTMTDFGITCRACHTQVVGAGADGDVAAWNRRPQPRTPAVDPPATKEWLIRRNESLRKGRA